MNTVKTIEPAFETDMRNLLRRKKPSASNHEGEQAKVEIFTLVSRISDQSINDVDNLIEGLQALRMKLDGERARIEHDIRSYAAFSQSIAELANIVAEGMAAIKSPNAISGIDDVAFPSESHAK
jgi:hypothetical protein